MISTIAFYVLIGFLIWAPIWATQFAQVMSLSESDFPDPQDKFRWYVAFLTVFLIAPVAFMVWKTIVLNARDASQAEASQES